MPTVQIDFASTTVSPDDPGTLFAVALPKDEATIEKAVQQLGDPVGEALKASRFAGKETDAFVYTRPSANGLVQIGLFGVGTLPVSEETCRNLGFRAGQAAEHRGLPRLCLDLGFLQGNPGPCHGARLVEGILLSCYKYRDFLSGEAAAPPRLSAAQVKGPARIAEGFDRGRAIAAGIVRARDLGNGPADLVTPTHLAHTAEAMAKAYGDRGVSVEIFDRGACASMGMGLFLAVAKGSAEPPKFLHLAYRPHAPRAKVAWVGKGVTFDSGGYSLKPTEAMLDMKMDMCGAAAVLGAFETAVRLGVPYEIHAMVAATENMIGPDAYRLGDVYRGMDGTTVEINNTDAEGRLTLADALVFASRQEPDVIVDVATLTGACMVALGPKIAGLMTHDDGLASALSEAAGRAGERLWRLPLPKDLEEQLESTVADVKNTGERWGGALTAGLFLSRFVGDRRWAHLDIAGPAMASKPWGPHGKGATGFGVATLVEALDTLPGGVRPAAAAQ